MAINTSKVVVGGIAAGVVVTLIDFVSYTYILGTRMMAEANAFKAGLGDQMSQMGGSAIAVSVLMNVVIGILLVWTYAAIRPRFGPGAQTAVYVGIVFWVFAAILTYGYKNMGMMSGGLWGTYALIWLGILIVASVVGAAIYTEESTA